MQRETATIINLNPDSLWVAASAARISTQPGTAKSIFAKSGDREKDLKLLGKVLSSGHKSVMEHMTFSVAFDDVSVLTEQFVIEFRLASYTVKSRRYVDFSDAGYLIPDGMSASDAEVFHACMKRRFADYEKLMALGVPKEDARFVLPYCLRSNFFMTVNARELTHMVCTMLYGRGSGIPELRHLGAQLKKQIDGILPGVIESESKKYHAAKPYADGTIRTGHEAVGDAELIGQPKDARELLKLGGDLVSVLSDDRPRVLEALNYTFRVKNCSLACLTHFTRHRIQSMLIPDIRVALETGNYVLPESVRTAPEALQVYRAAFLDQAEAAEKISDTVLRGYFCMSGHQLDFVMTMNARELAHFARLRTCSRAQWEIRGIARKMVALLADELPELFTNYGPSCAMTGKCPEGKMSCGHPVRIENGVWKTL